MSSMRKTVNQKSTISISPAETWNRNTLADGNLFANEFNKIYDAFNAILQGTAQSIIGTYIFSASEITDPDYVLCDGRVLIKADYPILYSKLGTNYNNITYTDPFDQSLSIDLPSAAVTSDQFRVPYCLGLAPIGINQGSDGFNANGLPGQVYGDKTRSIKGAFAMAGGGNVSGPFTRGNVTWNVGNASVGAGHKDVGWQGQMDTSRVIPTGTHGTAPSFNCFVYIRVSYSVTGLGKIA